MTTKEPGFVNNGCTIRNFNEMIRLSFNTIVFNHSVSFNFCISIPAVPVRVVPELFTVGDSAPVSLICSPNTVYQ